MIDPEQYSLSCAALANEYKRSPEFFRRMAREGKIPHVRLGNGQKPEYKFSREEVNEWWKSFTIKVARKCQEKDPSSSSNKTGRIGRGKGEKVIPTSILTVKQALKDLRRNARKPG
jgi:excisionase family DNA binding protein